MGHVASSFTERYCNGRNCNGIPLPVGETGHRL